MSGSVRKSKTAKTVMTSGALLSLGAALVGPIPDADAADFTVTDNGDAGSGTLRQAILDANAAAGPDTITINTTGPIVLTTGELDVTEDVTITGPGAASLTIDGNGASRIFYLQSAGAVTISGVTLTNGQAAGGGALKSVSTDLTLQDTVISESSSSNDGGGAAVSAGTLTITGGSFTNNYASSNGGGLYADHVTTLSITGTTFSGNTADGNGGGAALSYFGTATLSGITVSGNTSNSEGGGLYIDGGESSSEGAIAITGSTITGNTSDSNGGGIYSSYANLTMSTTTISGNTSHRYGGGMKFDDGVLLIDRSTISGNHATGGYGGGLSLDELYEGSAITSSTISGNDSTGGGAGIHLYGSPLTISHSTIASNTAGGEYAGGGIYADGNATLVLDHTIVADNTALTGADLHIDNTASVSARFSLIEAPISGPAITDNGGNVLGVDPQLQALAANGGPTQTQLLGATSPALNTGDPAFAAPPDTDQRGLARVAQGRIDIGAVEMPDAPVTTPVPTTVPPAAEGETQAATPVAANPTFTG